MQLAGALNLSTPSLRNFVAWLGGDLGDGAGLGAASLAGAASLDGNVLSVEEAAVTLDGNSATGAVGVTLAAQPEISGTLDFSALDLTPYFTGVAASLDRADDWRQVGIDTDWFGNLVADIRLSAASVTAGSLTFGETAATLLLKDARMEVGLAGAAFDGGTVTGALAIFDIPDMPEASYDMQLRATGVDLAQAAPAFGLPSDLSGIASLSVDVAAGGLGFDTLMTTLGGGGTVSIANGSVPLFGIDAIAAGASGNEAAADRAVPVEALEARIGFGQGIATLEEVAVQAADFTANATGAIGLLDGVLRLTGTVQPAAGTPRAFQIDGTVAAPQVSTQALAN